MRLCTEATRDTPSMATREEHGMVELFPGCQRVSAASAANIRCNCGWDTAHGTVGRLPQGQGVMVRTIGYLFILLLVVFAVQLVGTASADDCLRQWSPSPFQAHDQLPGSPDGEAESDQENGELEEFALAQGEAFRILPSTRACILDSTSCPRTDFVSDWFRPPVLS